jgi:hypothetical protein
MLLEAWLLIRVDLGEGRGTLSTLLTLGLSTLYWIGVAAALTVVVAAII